MTEHYARQICSEMHATLSIRTRKGKPYVYVARWIAAEALPPGWKLGTRGKGQSVDRYVCPLAKLPELSPDQLRLRILSLPQNPNKTSIPVLEGEQILDRSNPEVDQWLKETGL